MNHIPEPRFVKIKLPNSNLAATLTGSVFGLVLLAAVILTLIGQPSKGADWIGIALGLALGIGLLLYGVRAALKEHALLVYREAGRIVVLPSNHTLPLDRVESISVWRTTGEDPSRLRWRGARPWGVFLMLTDGQEVVVWEGGKLDTAHRVAHEISKEIDRPWIGGSKAH
jgi:hypothetical protein